MAGHEGIVLAFTADFLAAKVYIDRVRIPSDPALKSGNRSHGARLPAQIWRLALF